jgi:TATA-box binding protein (TBP) (component of TFIID and TFIIIB)
MDNDLRISTITSVLKLSQIIDLEKIYKQLPISEKYIPYIEYGCNNPPRGFSEKSLIKKRKKKQKKIFYNQATIHVIHDGKIMNVKLFNNGRIQITGLKNENQAVKLIKRLIQYFKDFDVMGDYTELIENKIVLINSDFDLGFEINREKLHYEIIENDIYSSYEPCIYPGVNIKYFINTNNTCGICGCENMCNGKGNGCGDGDCKKVTIAVFKSGKVIITGGQNQEQIIESYRFITNFIQNKKEMLKL